MHQTEVKETEPLDSGKEIDLIEINSNDKKFPGKQQILS